MCACAAESRRNTWFTGEEHIKIQQFSPRHSLSATEAAAETVQHRTRSTERSADVTVGAFASCII